MLGLGDIDELAGVARRRPARVRQPAQGRRAPARTRWSPRLDPDDEHAALVAAALGARKPDLDAIAAAARADARLQRRHRDPAPPRRPALPGRRGDPRGIQGRAGRRARPQGRGRDRRQARDDIAALLRRALAVRDPERLTDDCPVCGTPGRARRGVGDAGRRAGRGARRTGRGADAGRAGAARPPPRATALLDANARAAPLAAQARPPADAADVRLELASAATRSPPRPRHLRALSRRADRGARRARRGVAGALRPRRDVARAGARGRGARGHAEGAQGRREVGQGRGRGAAARSASRRSPSARSRTGASCGRGRRSTCTTSRSRSPAATGGRTSTCAPTARAPTRSA